MHVVKLLVAMDAIWANSFGWSRQFAFAAWMKETRLVQRRLAASVPLGSGADDLVLVELARWVEPI